MRMPGTMKVSTLLILCTVAAILAVVAFPAILEHSVRRHEHKDYPDMRILRTAIEMYYYDYHGYPGTRPLAAFADHIKRSELRKSGALRLTTIDSRITGLAGETTRIQYLDEIPRDPFSPEGKLPFAYAAKDGGWILFSPAYDGKYDIDPQTDYCGEDWTSAVKRLAPKTYDPTNGLGSSGDRWWIKF